MSMEFIRNTYGVPAMRGGRVEYTGGETPKRGTITSTNGAYLCVRIDGLKHSAHFHPTWKLNYLSATHAVNQ